MSSAAAGRQAAADAADEAQESVDAAAPDQQRQAAAAAAQQQAAAAQQDQAPQQRQPVPVQLPAPAQGLQRDVARVLAAEAGNPVAGPLGGGLAYSEADIAHFSDNHFTNNLALLQRNDTTLASMQLYSASNDPNTIRDLALAHGLESNTSIRRVMLGISSNWTWMENWSAFLRVVGSSERGLEVIGLLDISPMLREEEINHERMEANVRAILQQIHGLSTLTELDIGVPVAVDALVSFLDSAPPSFEKLAFSLPNFAAATELPMLAAAIERRLSSHPFFLMLPPCSRSTLALLQSFAEKKIPFPSASHLGFEMHIHMDEALLSQILRFLSQLKISRLFLLVVRSPAVFSQIIEALPTWNVQFLSISVELPSGIPSLQGLKRSFRDAVKRNFCLQRVGIVEEFLNDTEQEEITFYMDRNKRFAQWIERPDSVPEELWFYAMDLAVKAGVNSLYQSLIALSGHQIGLREESRQRESPPSNEHPRSNK